MPRRAGVCPRAVASRWPMPQCGTQFRSRVSTSHRGRDRTRERMQDVSSEQLEIAVPEPELESDDQGREREAEAILQAVDSAKLDTLLHRVAWILSRYPETRDSDVALYRRFWTILEGQYCEGEYVHLDNLAKLTRPTSLSRAPALLQNKYRLFVASPEVQRRRGKLSEEERDRVLSLRPAFASYTAYADESGKNDDHLVVGAVWFLGPEILEVTRLVEQLAKAAGFPEELHFKEITDQNVGFYQTVIDQVLNYSATIGFTSISVERRGHKSVDQVLRDLYYHLVRRAIEHFDETGRAPLPRSLSVIKDAENPGPDKLLLADLEDRLKQAGKALYEGRLYVDRLYARDSKSNIPLQLADLYTSAVSRVLNAKGKRHSARDRLANYFLGRLGIPHGFLAEEKIGDMTVHLAL